MGTGAGECQCRRLDAPEYNCGIACADVYRSPLGWCTVRNEWRFSVRCYDRVIFWFRLLGTLCVCMYVCRTLWDSVRSTALHTYKWGADSILCVRFNPAESCLLASTGSDRGVCLYDLRAPVPMRKVIVLYKSSSCYRNILFALVYIRNEFE